MNKVNINFRNVLGNQLVSTSIDSGKYTTLTFDSNQVIDGTLFICKGVSFKKDYLLAAIERGATTYISEIDYNVDIPLIKVKDIRLSMIEIGNCFYGRPQDLLRLVGITGTKGKTTTTYLIKHIFKHQIGLLSSIETYDGNTLEAAVLTTPEYLDILKKFRVGVDNGLDKFVIEVSSQAIKVDRTTGLFFEIGIFLNISPDHISSIEHSDFEDYFTSKLKLFKQTKYALVNLDSDHIERILVAAKNGAQKVITFSTKNSSADYYASEIINLGQSISFKLNDEPFELGMIGTFNVENAAAAIISGHLLGLSFEQIREGLKEIRVPGRMESFVSEDKNLKILVDYAHNTLSFERLFEFAKNDYPDHEIFIIFGCPGGKAINRRYDLGVIANKYADKVFLCSEDPNYDNPTTISNEIKEYINDTDVYIIDDRKEALREAINQVTKQTVILFTGKGDETFQKINGKSVEVQSDISITKELLNEFNINKK